MAMRALLALRLGRIGTITAWYLHVVKVAVLARYLSQRGNIQMQEKHGLRNTGFVPATTLFILGFGLFVFTRRSELVPTLPAAIVVAPVFILRFSRILPPRRAVPLTLLGFVVSMNVALWGLFDISDAGVDLTVNVIRSTLLALLYALPYLIDRGVIQWLGQGLLTTLVFPSAVTAAMFLSSLEIPFDGTVGKTVYAVGPLSLMQLYAITGLWGFIFLWSWLAALVNHAWNAGFSYRSTLRAGIGFVAVFGLVLAFGFFRLATSGAPETVKLAAVVLLPDDGIAVSMERFYAEKISSPYEETLARIAKLTAAAAANGARIVAFQENAMAIAASDIDRLRADYRSIAANNRVWLSVTYVWYADEGKGANMHLLIDDHGRIRADYQKRFLLGLGPYGETGVFAKGPEVIQTVDTPYGRVAVSTCRDMSFPRYARQAGESGADIMLTPSYDFPRSTGMSDSGRALDTGFTHVRPTYNGVSYVMDPYGRVLGRMDSADGGDGILYADVPVRGAKTLYVKFGDWFGWLNLAALLFFSGAAIRKPRG